MAACAGRNGAQFLACKCVCAVGCVLDPLTTMSLCKVLCMRWPWSWFRRQSLCLPSFPDSNAFPLNGGVGFAVVAGVQACVCCVVWVGVGVIAGGVPQRQFLSHFAFPPNLLGGFGPSDGTMLLCTVHDRLCSAFCRSWAGWHRVVCILFFFSCG